MEPCSPAAEGSAQMPLPPGPLRVVYGQVTLRPQIPRECAQSQAVGGRGSELRRRAPPRQEDRAQRPPRGGRPVLPGPPQEGPRPSPAGRVSLRHLQRGAGGGRASGPQPPSPPGLPSSPGTPPTWGARVATGRRDPRGDLGPRTRLGAPGTGGLRMALCVSALCGQRRLFHPRWVPGPEATKAGGQGSRAGQGWAGAACHG